MVLLSSFPPLLGSAPRLLVLGTMPGARSLAAQQYYAHPQNAFWKIWEAIVGLDATAPYPARAAALTEAGVAVWDVLAHCERATSLDADISRTSEVPNAIGMLLHAHPSIGRVICNGGAAASQFSRHIAPTLTALPQPVEVIRAPSTSPAHASLRLAQKIDAWRALVGELGGCVP